MMKKYYLVIVMLISALCLTACKDEQEISIVEDIAWEEVKEEDESDIINRKTRELGIQNAQEDVVKAFYASSEPEFEGNEGKAWVPSSYRKDVKIPTFFVIPEDYDENKSFPMVIMMSGYAGDHNLDGGFNLIAEQLAECGIIVAMYDNPAMGISKEDTMQYTLTNIKHDAMNVIEYMQTKFNIDKVGAFGFSLGSRVILEMINEDYYCFDAIDLWAPAVDTEDFTYSLYGELWDKLRSEAQENGYADFNGEIYSLEWFQDLQKYKDNLAADTAKKYTNPVMVIYSVTDEAVNPYISQNTAKVFHAAEVANDKGGHTCGMFGEDEVAKQASVKSTVLFFADRLGATIPNE